MDRTFFEQGETIEEFLSSLTATKEKFTQLMDDCVFTEKQLEEFTQNNAEINVMVIAEDWSGDVLYNLPVLFRMATQAGWNVRIFRRDSHPDLILPYRKDGLYHSIPVFVFFDENFNEMGNWVERPALATKVIDEESLNLRRRLREENKVAWREETIKELMDLVS